MAHMQLEVEKELKKKVPNKNMVWTVHIYVSECCPFVFHVPYILFLSLLFQINGTDTGIIFVMDKISIHVTSRQNQNHANAVICSLLPQTEILYNTVKLGVLYGCLTGTSFVHWPPLLILVRVDHV